MWAVHLFPHSGDVLHKELPICKITLPDTTHVLLVFLVVGRDPGEKRIPDALVFLLYFGEGGMRDGRVSQEGLGVK